MKIRRYKGTNREELYSLIHKEMGPDAIVVAPETSGGFLFGRGGKYELIAILDDSGNATPMADQERPEGVSMADDFRRWSRQQTRQWKDLQSTMSEIRKTVETLQGGRASAEVPEVSLPAYARLWDPRFCARAKEEAPALFNEDFAAASQALASSLPVATDFNLKASDGKPHIIVLTGPTGSGKTTTLAKLAAICRHQEGLRVGIVTTDTYRVAAVDQIREYAVLLDVELRVVFTADEARTAITELAHNDVILVDTPGRTHFDEMGLAISHKILRGMGAVTVLLTIPATLNRDDLADVVSGFSRFQPRYLVVTKIDETRQPALFTSLPFETDLKVVFVTNGQRVPQDIFAGDSEQIANLLLRPSSTGAPPAASGVKQAPRRYSSPATPVSTQQKVGG